MNITHAVSEEINGDKLEAIFARQQELMNKYHDIEERSGLLQTSDCPVNLDDKRGQARLKDFSWRVTEELGEALDARHDEEHFKEELVDGLHFLTELSILAGTDPHKLVENAAKKAFLDKNIPDSVLDEDTLEALVFISNRAYGQFAFEGKVTKFVENIGMTCNCLKNKPWKQSNMITDKEAFYKNLSKAWVAYLSIMAWEMPVAEITDIYFKKSQVNKFRQRSNY